MGETNLIMENSRGREFLIGEQEKNLIISEGIRFQKKGIKRVDNGLKVIGKNTKKAGEISITLIGMIILGRNRGVRKNRLQGTEDGMIEIEIIECTDKILTTVRFN